MGSPPLTRGPQIHDFAFYHWLRITPAHAGTTLPPCNPLRLAEDHPRSRGDHRSGHSLRSIKYGSPPLTRGPPISRLRGLCISRITPAHAGTTPSLRPPWTTRWDHPRSRGDHYSCQPSYRDRLGSPPLTRGPHPVALSLAQRKRITPAHAGTTPTIKQEPDHPYICFQNRGNQFFNSVSVLVLDFEEPSSGLIIKVMPSKSTGVKLLL